MLARKIAADKQQSQQPQTTVTTVVVHKAKVTLGEKVLVVAFALILVFLAVKIVSNQYSIYTINKDIQKAEASVDEQVKENNDLKVQVSELSRYERIWEKASKLGLKLDENNVKVVQD
ncbi:cell division protein FtsL [Bacillus sp. 1P06AnD]|uniref:cell division protein FtsL n=1 Tax=Bacillus sp. 1P06AnD TaxID=3132208 RepID=UPI0039A2FD76